MRSEYNVSAKFVYCNVPSAEQHYQRHDEIFVRFQGRVYDAVVVEEGKEYMVRHFTKHWRYNHSMFVQVVGRVCAHNHGRPIFQQDDLRAHG
jgi:hypothetical protein